MANPMPSEPPRVLARVDTEAAAFYSASEDIHGGTVWEIQRPQDTVIIHLGGPIDHLVTELPGAGATVEPPMPGEIWVVPAGQRYTSIARGGRVRYAELQFDRSAALRLAGEPLAGPPVRARAGHFDEFLYRAALRLETLARAGGRLDRMAAESLTTTLLLDFYSRYGTADGVEPAPRRIRLLPPERSRVESLIASHLGSPIRIAWLAAAVTMTPHEFLIAFRAAFGTTPAQYIIDQRLRRARWLLSTSAKPVAEIAFETGFSSHAHLSAAFRDRFHLTPSEFRGGARMIATPLRKSENQTT